MDVTAALRWAALYRLVSWLFGLVFLAFLGLAYLLGLGDVVWTLAYGNRADLIAFGTVPPVLLAVVGFVVWQVGSTAAFYKATTEAVDEQLAEQFDAELVKSEILAVLDERLSEMHDELVQTRREVGGSAGATTGGSQGSFEFEE